MSPGPSGDRPGRTPRAAPLLWTAVCFCGLLAVYGSLNLAARGRGAAAGALAAAGVVVAAAAGVLLDRSGRA